MLVKREIKLGSGATIEVVIVDTDSPSAINYFECVFRTVIRKYQVASFTEEPITTEKE